MVILIIKVFILHKWHLFLYSIFNERKIRFSYHRSCIKHNGLRYLYKTKHIHKIQIFPLFFQEKKEKKHKGNLSQILNNNKDIIIVNFIGKKENWFLFPISLYINLFDFSTRNLQM